MFESMSSGVNRLACRRRLAPRVFEEFFDVFVRKSNRVSVSDSGVTDPTGFNELINRVRVDLQKVGEVFNGPRRCFHSVNPKKLTTTF